MEVHPEAQPLQRCAWVGDDLLYRDYHDYEWGRPQHDGRALFELLCLEGQQAGLSWITVLKKRAHYREVFHEFEPVKVAAMTEKKIDRLMQDAGLIRHRGKLAAIVGNARAYMALSERGEDFSKWLWALAGGTPHLNHWATIGEVPVKTVVSDAMSKALKKAGFKFIGSTICYAFMQAGGMVNDHTTDCFCHPDHEKRTSR